MNWTPVDLRGQLPTREGAPAYHRRDVADVVGVTVHYSASPALSGRQAVEAIARYQTGPNAHEAFPAIAYHLVVDAGGDVYLCHDLDVRVWHSAARPGGIGRNQTHVAICYLGDVEPNAAQLSGLARGIRWAESELRRSLDVEGHGDAWATLCPGSSWARWRNDLCALVGQTTMTRVLK